MRRAGYRIVCNPKAKVWHDIPLLDKDKASQHYVSSSLRAYYTARNRIVFHKNEEITVFNLYYSIQLDYCTLLFKNNYI